MKAMLRKINGLWEISLFITEVDRIIVDRIVVDEIEIIDDLDQAKKEKEILEIFEDIEDLKAGGTSND